jgi:hypothetical protein
MTAAPNAPKPGRYRYLLSRPCLDSGSIAVLKYLESVLPMSGSVVFVADGGEEIKLTANPQTRRLYGLSDYFAKRRLNVNDTLFITVLGPNRYSLESVSKPREGRHEPVPRPAPPPKPQRVVIEETPHVREIRTTEVTHTPYAKGLIYPQDKDTRDSTNPQKPLETQREPRTAAEKTRRLVAQDRGRRVTEDRGPDDTSETTPPKPEVRFPVDASVLEQAKVTFSALGYAIEPLTTQGLKLEARLGRRAHSIALAVTNDAAEAQAVFEFGRGQAVKYNALLANPGELVQLIEQPGLEGAARVDQNTLEPLLNLSKLAPVGPPELEGYWNAGRIDETALESLELSVQDSVQSRGTFSFVALSLARFQAPCVITAAEVMANLEFASIGSGTVIETLEMLSRAPFVLLSPLGNGEYYLRRAMFDGLEGMAAYANGLRSRLQVTTNAAVRADAARPGAGRLDAGRADTGVTRIE